MGQLDTIAQYAARNPYTGQSGADGDELYEAAWGAAVEALCAATERPNAQHLIGSGFGAGSCRCSSTVS